MYPESNEGAVDGKVLIKTVVVFKFPVKFLLLAFANCLLINLQILIAKNFIRNHESKVWSEIEQVTL